MSDPTVHCERNAAGNERKRHTKLPLMSFVGVAFFALGSVVVVVGGVVVVVVGAVVDVEPTVVVVVVDVVVVDVTVVVVVVGRVVAWNETGRYRRLARN
ncbi:MAG TPA: hypothetical protein VMV11_06065 [Acidimicrobiales bacterium]|nr:hypothetical protein [Acidimicrobiales bacterium]